MEKELIIKPFAPPQWAGLARVPGLTPLLTRPVGMWPTWEDHRKLGPRALNNKAFCFWKLPGQEISEAD